MDGARDEVHELYRAASVSVITARLEPDANKLAAATRPTQIPRST